LNARTIQRGRKLVWHGIKREQKQDLRLETQDKLTTEHRYQREAPRANQTCRWSLQKTTKPRQSVDKKGELVAKSVEPTSPRAREIPLGNVNPENIHRAPIWQNNPETNTTDTPILKPFLERTEPGIDPDIEFVPPPKRRAPKYRIT
jgi:hypothetical protein